MLSCSMKRRASERSRRGRRMPPGVRRGSTAIDALTAIDIGWTRPCWRRSSGRYARPRRSAARGERGRNRLPSIQSSPASSLSMPKMLRATSVLPAPTNPARPTISPRWRSKETFENTPRCVSPRALRTTSPTSDSSLGKSASRERPTISRMISACESPAAGRVAMWRPSRSTVTVSAIASTSSSRWLMKTTATPRSRSLRTVANSLSTSCGESAAVGSSMISSRALDVSALAISSSWRSATPSPRTGVSGAKSAPSSRRMRDASVRIARQSTVPIARRGWRPAKTFSATVRSWKTVGSWYIATIPSRCADCGSARRCGSPSTRSSPPSG